VKPGFRGGAGRRKGSTLIEFSLVALLLCLLLLVFVDFGRMLLIYNGISNAAREGTRYAIVHGANRTGSGIDGPSSSSDYSQVQTVVRSFASSAGLSPGDVTVTVTYSPGNNIGDLVEVTAAYSFSPFVGYFPLRVNMRSASHGVIAY
jgi:Flp pilus assembly protein TadG